MPASDFKGAGAPRAIGEQGAPGDADGALWWPSPNAGPRRPAPGGAIQPSLIVLHFTAMESVEAARARLCDPAHEVSAHYLIGRDGALWQLVAERDRAWHAGSGAWGRVRDVNSASIGIEIDNDGQSPFAEPAMGRLETLLPDIMARWGIGREAVIGHSDCAPGRKADPGRRFDWRRLARRGLSIWPEPDPATQPGQVGPIGPLLARAGYTAEASAAARLTAVRLRFRPWALPEGGAGPAATAIAADATDRALLAALPPGPGMADGVDGGARPA